MPECRRPAQAGVLGDKSAGQRALLIPVVVLAWLAVLMVAAWLLGHVTRALLILVLAAFIAFALTPLVNGLTRWMPRAIALALSYLVGFIVVVGLLGVVVATAGAQLVSFAGQVPSELHQARGLQSVILGFLKPWGITVAQLAEVQAQAVSQLQNVGTTLASSGCMSRHLRPSGVLIGIVNQVVGGLHPGHADPGHHASWWCT